MSATQPIANAIQSVVERGQLAGAGALVWRDGRIVDSVCVGWRDVDAKLPIQCDTLFRIASLSKPVTSTLALMLFEEGRFELSDSIARWAPEFSQQRVLRFANGRLDATDPAERPITFEDLLTHRSGLTYGDFHRGPITHAYASALGGHIDTTVAPDDWIARLAALPLIDQPGNAFHYGHSTDLLGLLIARMEDAPLGEAMARRIFGPLGMQDTSFTVPNAKAARRARMYGFDAAGLLTALTVAPGAATLPERPLDTAYESGGQGLWSTLNDYLRFARVFIGRGVVDGIRLLQPETLQLMTMNRLTDAQRAKAEVLGTPLFAGHGFGLGVATVLDPAQAEPTVCGGGVGAVGWSGGYGSWWQADPNDNSVLLFMTHSMVDLAQLESGIGLGVYDAIAQFQSLASGTSPASLARE